MVKCRVRDRKIADSWFDFKTDSVSSCSWERHFTWILPLGSSILLSDVAKPDERVANQTQRKCSALVWSHHSLFISRLETDSFVLFFFTVYLRCKYMLQVVQSNQSNTRDCKKSFPTRVKLFLQCSSLFLHAPISSLLIKSLSSDNAESLVHTNEGILKNSPVQLEWLKILIFGETV